MKDIEDSIEGWIGKPITNVCNEFLFEVRLSLCLILPCNALFKVECCFFFRTERLTPLWY